MMAALHTCVVRVNLFLFMEDAGQYQEYGSVGCAIMGTLSDPPLYKMGCYNEKNEYLCTRSITTNNETGASIALQRGGYVSFKDEEGRNWSMQFETEAHAIEFCAHVSVAMYGASGRPDRSIIACDVTAGKRERSVFANDLVKVRYQSWVIQCEDHQKGLPILGSRLDGNLQDDKPCTTAVPANHLSVTTDMKGFEGMMIGMGEEGSRLVVIPLKAKRGGGPQVHMCFYIHLVRKKDPSSASGGCQPATTSLVTTSPSVAEQAMILPHSARPGTVSRSRSPLPGFSREQLLVVDRLRDQVHVLSRQLQETRQQLDIFMNDVRTFDRRAKPQSLASAQVVHSIQKLLSDTDEGKELLDQKDVTLRQMEDRNRELQQKLDRFTEVTKLLSEEKKDAISSSNEEKLDMDRRIAQAQAQLTRLHSEREDVARHLSTVKRLLQVSNEDVETEKRNLQMASAVLQSNESKLVVLEENHAEEVSRRRILESKVVTLGDRLRSTLEEIRLKEGQIEERRKKMEEDQLYYTRLMEDERSKGAADVRELREELTNELAVRERRYQEERQRVAHEAFERGRLSGVEDGHAEALLEADAATQELTLDLQRRKAEVKAICIRLKRAKALNEADESRLSSQLAALQDALVKLQSENSQLEAELHSLTAAREEVVNGTFAEIRSVIEQLSHPVGRGDLLTIMHLLKCNRNVSYEFEVQRIEEEKKTLGEERKEVVEWISGFVDNIQIPFPPMRTRHAWDEPPVSGNAPAVTCWNEVETSKEVVESRSQDQMRNQEAELHFDPDEMNRRYHVLFSELMSANPDLELAPQRNLFCLDDGLCADDNVSHAQENRSCAGDADNPPSLHAKEQVENSQKQEIFLPPPESQPQEEQRQHEGNLQDAEREFILGRLQEVERSPRGSPGDVSGKRDTHSQPHIPEWDRPDGARDEFVDEPHAAVEIVAPKPHSSAQSCQDQIVPLQSRGLLFSDSGSESDSMVPVGRNADRAAPRAVVPPMKSLFSDSDSSNGSINRARTVTAQAPSKHPLPKRGLFEDSDSS